MKIEKLQQVVEIERVHTQINKTVGGETLKIQGYADRVTQMIKNHQSCVVILPLMC